MSFSLSSPLRPACLCSLLLAAALPAAEPVRLAPRPIPGLARPAPAAHAHDHASAARKPAVARAAAVPAPPAGERARVVFVHRRERLPEALTRALPPVPAAAAAAGAEIPVSSRPARLRIIPKAEVAGLRAPESPTP